MNDIDISELAGKDNAYLTTTMLTNMSECLVISAEFLRSLKSSSVNVIRAIVAGHINTPPDVLEELLHDSSKMVSFAAYDNPCTPFKPVLLKESEFVFLSKVSDSETIARREKDYLNMLSDYNLQANDVNSMPFKWLITIIR